MLIGLVEGNDALGFSYDASSQVQAVDFNGTYYYYLRNGQGDVVKLIDGNRNTVVEYAYDSWGKPLSCTGTLATTLGALNPFRYRGYVYDEETQWYYLKSRYYDPETCRFISADVLLSTGQEVVGNNSFVYCGNNPIARIDSEGEFWNVIVGAVGGAIFGALDAAIKQDASTSDIIKGALVGAVTGAAVGATLGIGLAIAAGGSAGATALGAIVATVGGGFVSGEGEKLRQSVFHEERDDSKIATARIVGGIGNLFGFGAGRIVHGIVIGKEVIKKGAEESVGRTILKEMTHTLTSKGANATAERIVNMVIGDLWVAPLQYTATKATECMK